MKLIIRFLRMLLFLTLLLLVYSMGKAQEVDAENSLNDSLCVIIQTADSVNTDESVGVNSQYIDKGMIEDAIPRTPVLNQNYPNPFNPKTVISYQLPDWCNVELKIYSATGQTVGTLVDERQPAGSYRHEWDAGALASGVYFYRLKAREFVQMKKLILLK